MVEGCEVALGLDLIIFYQQHKPTAGASLNVAQRATSRLVIQIYSCYNQSTINWRFRMCKTNTIKFLHMCKFTYYKKINTEIN